MANKVNNKSVTSQLAADLEADKQATESIELRATRALMSAESKRKELMGYYTSEEKEKIQVSPMYRPYFGNVMPVSLNGISIFFPINGTVHEVPKSFADVIQGRVYSIDQMLLKQKRLSDVPNNFESTPGALNLF